VKSGFLALITSEVNENVIPKLQAMPVYTTLTPKGLTFYESLNSDSVLKFIPWKYIGVIISPNNWDQMNCF